MLIKPQNHPWLYQFTSSLQFTISDLGVDHQSTIVAPVSKNINTS